MKVLIIGGMGVIGGAITTAASKHGHDITVVSRRELTSEWNLPGVCGISGNWKDKDFASNVVKEVFDVIVDTQVFDVKQIIRSMDIVNGHCKQYIYISTDACCVFDAKTDKLILAYKGAIDTIHVENQLKDKLQEYMVPGEYHKMDNMIFNINGKVDRKAIENLYCKA